MSDYDIGTYGERWAPHYDAVFSETDFEVEFLEELAGEPPRALELGEEAVGWRFPWRRQV
jgi:hypothetical protein